MTSHYRHRRIYDPAAAFPSLVEPGEIAVNTANRQMVVGDANPASPGAPIALLAVRIFDAKAKYAANEFVVQAGNLYRSKGVLNPGVFNAAQWDLYASETSLKGYIDAADTAIVSGYEAADSALQTQVNGKVSKAGDTMTGNLNVPPPTIPSHATTKQYVDEQIAAGGIVTLPALDVSYVSGGAIASTNVQAAIAELDSEKAPLYSPTFLGEPLAPMPVANDNSTKIATTAWVNNYTVTYVTSFMQDYVDGALSAILGTAMPQAPGTAAVGTSTKYAREDHRHPADPTRAPSASPVFTGDPRAPTPAPGDNDTSIATTAFVQAALGANPAAIWFSTGDVKLTYKTVADTGWVMLNDGTMGDATSGGTTRANADTVNLFTLLWTNIPNIYCPVLPGGRGVDAATDFAAHKTIKLAAALGRSLGIAGVGAGLTARALGQTVGAETETLDISKVPPNSVTLNVSMGTKLPGGTVKGLFFRPGSTPDSTLTAESDLNAPPNSTVDLGTTGGGGAHNNMQPTSFLNAMVKL